MHWSPNLVTPYLQIFLNKIANTVNPSYSQVLYPRIQPTKDWNYLKEKNNNNTNKSQ